MAKPNGYKKFVQTKVNRDQRRDARLALRQGRLDDVRTDNPRRQVAWLAS